MTTRDGRVHKDGERLVLRFERLYGATPQEVWAALTDPDQLARWLFRGKFEPKAGGAMAFDFGEHGEHSGSVIAWEEPVLLEYEWGGHGEAPWRVRWELRPDGAGTLLVLEHLAPDPTQGEYGAGWHWHLDRLEVLLRGQTPPAVDSDEHFEALLAAYQARADHPAERGN